MRRKAWLIPLLLAGYITLIHAEMVHYTFTGIVSDVVYKKNNASEVISEEDALLANLKGLSITYLFDVDMSLPGWKTNAEGILYAIPDVLVDDPTGVPDPYIFQQDYFYAKLTSTPLLFNTTNGDLTFKNYGVEQTLNLPTFSSNRPQLIDGRNTQYTAIFLDDPQISALNQWNNTTRFGGVEYLERSGYSVSVKSSLRFPQPVVIPEPPPAPPAKVPEPGVLPLMLIGSVFTLLTISFRLRKYTAAPSSQVQTLKI